MSLRPWLAVPLVLALVPDWSRETRLPLLGPVAEVRAERVALFPDTPGARRLGALRYLGGIRLTSPDPAFGSFSAMSVAGERVTLLSDGGNIVRFRLDPRLRPSDARFADLPAGPGTGWNKADRDSESLTRDPQGRFWVGFERANAIWRYTPDLRRAERAAAPPPMARWELNGGPEAMLRLRSGAFIVIAEVGPRRGVRPGIRFDTDPTEAPRRGFRFSYRPPANFSPVDLAELPDGRLLVLNRRVSFPGGFTARLVLVDPRSIRPGATVEGRAIARFEPPAIHDNFEALAVTVEHGRPIVWIASDDNQAWFQQSLLLKFRLDLAPARPNAR